MKAIKAFIAHLSLAMLLGFLVIAYVDGRNPLMAFLTSKVTKVYIIIMCALGLLTAIMYIAELRKNR